MAEIIRLRLKYRVWRPSKRHQHGRDDTGGNGKAGRRRARGWRKGWVKDYIRLTGATRIPQVGSFGSPKKEG